MVISLPERVCGDVPADDATRCASNEHVISQITHLPTDLCDPQRPSHFRRGGDGSASGPLSAHADFATDRPTPYVADVKRSSRELLQVSGLPGITLDQVAFPCQTSAGCQMSRAVQNSVPDVPGAVVVSRKRRDCQSKAPVSETFMALLVRPGRPLIVSRRTGPPSLFS